MIGLDEIPSRSVVGVINDVHIPHEDTRAVKLAIECFEDNGVTHMIADGDIHDCGIASPIKSKKAHDVMQWGTLERSSKKGKYLFDWLRTRTTYFLFGNHEAWLEKFLQEDPALSAVDPMDLLALPRNGEGWTVLPSNSRLRYGSFVIEHGHGVFAKGNGGSNPASRIKAVAPQQVTLIGHLHRDFRAVWTIPNSRGIDVLYGCSGAGHMSKIESHEDYMGGYANWQQSFRILYPYEVDSRIRMTIDHILIHRDHRDRPYFEYKGKVYK